ncbi:MAG: MBOAT family protein [Firmicutes bacterium]|nr:MBOAT family protein [Bacillota bacterium]
MIFNTWTFGLFLLIFAALYWLIPGRARAAALLLGGLVFYTYYYPPHTIFIVVLSLAVFGLGWLVEHSPEGAKKKTWLAAGIVLCLSSLGYFKYWKLLLATLNQAYALAEIEISYQVVSPLVPLGMSFFVFEFIHYLVDVYRGTARTSSLLNFGVFAMFFPTLVAGPIKRYQPFLQQLQEPRTPRTDMMLEGAARIVLGIAKKVVIADSMTSFITPFHNPAAATNTELWIAIYAYSLKIFFDFSGYSDIALGSARVLGFDIMENFNYPYLRSNVSEFWRSWHISLSSWIRDYLYIPLGGNRKGEARTMVNTMAAMGLCGLWHGASWNFVVWGLYHGMGLVFYRLYHKLVNHFSRGDKPAEGGGIGRLWGWAVTGLSVFITFNFVSVGWVFFVNGTREAFYILGRILGLV